MTMRSFATLASTLGGALMPTQCVTVGYIRYVSVTSVTPWIPATCQLYPLRVGYIRYPWIIRHVSATYSIRGGVTILCTHPVSVSMYNTGTVQVPVIDLS